MRKRDLFSSPTGADGGSSAASSLPEGTESITSPSTKTKATQLTGYSSTTASLFQAPVSEEALPTSATSGPSGAVLSRSAALQSFLVNRSRVRTAALGSTLFKMSFKHWSTPSRRRIYVLRASVRRRFVNDCGLLPRAWRALLSGSDSPERAELSHWPTPDASGANVHDTTWEERRKKVKEKLGNGNGFGLTLGMAARLASWPAPCAQDGPKGGPSQGADRLPGAVSLACWATPLASDTRGPDLRPERRPRSGGYTLSTQAILSSYPTPTATDADRRGKMGETINKTLNHVAQMLGPARLTVFGRLLTGSSAATNDGGPLNPELSRWLMGLPPIWDACAPAAVYKGSRRSKSMANGQAPTA